jgi:hypothetical protein
MHASTPSRRSNSPVITPAGPAPTTSTGTSIRSMWTSIVRRDVFGQDFTTEAQRELTPANPAPKKYQQRIQWIERIRNLLNPLNPLCCFRRIFARCEHRAE